MGTKSSLLIAIVIASISVYISLYWRKTELPKHYLDDNYFGVQNIKDGAKFPEDDKKIEKFTINIDESVLIDLKARLNRTRVVDSIAGSNFEYGTNSETLKKVIDYWMNKYDWRAQEKRLNKYDHFTTQIEGIKIHFLHIKPSNPGSNKVLPLMLVHGWPGSFVEFYKIIPLLTTPKNGIVFELVIPSIPGFGFSEGGHKQGLNVGHAARIFVKLMKRLGHEKFYYHGGDWGAIIGELAAKYFPANILGYHTTLLGIPTSPCIFIKTLIGYVFPNFIYENPAVESKMLTPLMDKLIFIIQETGYMHLHATKPDTVGAGLNDSPAGLASYILEKFSTWVNPSYINKPEGGLFEKFTIDELLTNIMIYWSTESIVTSQRFYRETLPKLFGPENAILRLPVKKEVPVGVAMFEHEIYRLPKFAAKTAFENLIHYETFSKGGHFAAFEEPEIIANDIKKFVARCIEAANKEEK